MTRPSPKAAIIRSGAMPSALPSWTWARTPQIRPGTNLLMTPMKKIRAMSEVRAFAPSLPASAPPSTTRTRQESIDRTSPAALARRAATSSSTPPGRPAACAISVPAPRSEPPTAKQVATIRTSAAASRRSRARRDGRTGAASGTPSPGTASGAPPPSTASAAPPPGTASEAPPPSTGSAVPAAPSSRVAVLMALPPPPAGPRGAGRKGRSPGPPASGRPRGPRRGPGPGAPRSAGR